MAINNKLSIEQCLVSDLVAYINNSRMHSDEQVDQIAASIKEFGFCNPVLIDDEGGVIAGHGRLMAAIKLGIEQVPTIRLLGLSETQKRAYIIADNSIALNASWNIDLLLSEVEFLNLDDFDVSILALPDSLLSVDTEDLDFDGDGETGLSMPKMRFGNTTIEISQQELDGLNEAYRQYTENTGSSYGFVEGVLLNGK